jgi:superfamily II DNA or RNA helicase
MIKIITHQSVYKIHKDKVFEKVNSYEEMNNAIKRYGESLGSHDSEGYRNGVGMPFEIFTQYFCIRYNESPILGIKDIRDTSSDPFNVGYDFTYTSMFDKAGQIQSKWRGNPRHQFTLGELAINSAIASDMGIEADNNILFINIDDRDDLFHYQYTTARNKRRIIGRDTQEFWIERDPKFWDDFRKCIKESTEDKFEDPYIPREIQDWILNGHEKNGIKYLGTEKVLDGTLSKGKVGASTGAGKTLCQYYNIDTAFKKYGKKLAVMVLPTRSLIDQTFREFYKWKMFGYKTEDGKEVDTGVSCLIIKSGGRPSFDPELVNVLQELDIDKIVSFIETEMSKGRKVVVFTTMKSQSLKYSSIVERLQEKNIRIGLELVDEYHNIISNSSDRAEQLEIAEYLKNSSDRTDGSIFYSASNKNGEILSSFNEDLFGPLLANVNRNDLRERGFVCPFLIFKIIRVKQFRNSSEDKRNASKKGLDLDKAQSEGVAIISAFNDLKNYYNEPNLITFGDHVEGCRHISKSEEMSRYLPEVSNHFMAAETTTGDRLSTMDSIRESGNNILHQHSVAKEGINIPNLHSGLIGRMMNIIGIQQAIGRSDRALYIDTLNFEKGLITLDSPEGWVKPYNIIYLVVDSDETFAQRLKDIVRYLLDQGIPEDQWDITAIDDEGKGGSEPKKTNSDVSVAYQVDFDSENFKKMIEQVKIEIQNEEEQAKIDLEELREKERLNSMPKKQLLLEKLKNTTF